MIRLDMDRGLTAFQGDRAGARPRGWRAADPTAEVLDIVRVDPPGPGEFPWGEDAQAARLRGLTADAESLRCLPCTVLSSAELIARLGREPPVGNDDRRAAARAVRRMTKAPTSAC